MYIGYWTLNKYYYYYVCLFVLVNCLLNAFAICVGEVNVFSLKVMVLYSTSHQFEAFYFLNVIC